MSEHNGTTQLYKRSMDRFEPPQPIPGTEKAYNPFFSPDGAWIGFFAHDRLKKVSLQGGAPEILCSVTGSYGAAWTPDDRIFFGQGDQLSWVTASGGTPQVLTGNIAGGYAFLWPSLLPDNQHLLLMNNKFTAYAVSLETGQQKLLMEDAKYPRYIPTGHLTFVRRGKLMAVPFNLTRLEVTGPPVSILDNVRTESSRGAAHYAFSAKGTLAYLEGGDAAEGRFVWVDRQGVVVDTLPLPPDNYGIARLSPDGQRLAYGYNHAQSNIWIYDLERGGTSSELFTTEGSNGGPHWTPDGTKIAFSSDRREGISDVYWKAVTGGEAELLVSSDYFNAAGSWTPDGRVFLYAEVRPSTGWDILTFSMEKETSQPFVTTPATEATVAISPEGNYVAYMSNKSKQPEVYVKPYPPTDEEWIISTDGGAGPHWSPDGSELYYQDLTQHKMMVVSIKRTPAFDRGLPQVLFEGNYLTIPGPSYDVSRDGTRFLMLKGTEDKTAWTQVNVVTNWFEELKRLVPTDE